MRLDQFIDHRDDAVGRERRRGVRVHERGLVDEFPTLLHRGADRELDDVQERAVQRQALRRERSHPLRMHAVGVDDAGHLNAGVLR